ncbi:hypothetical protein [Natrinema salinisoli]|uniref:hypothetical protein n=1 Tax=Natrinema salinisoli TaxID=2878535 RepID=UPI001CF084F5|nr:hypothetical protein [Natrinema salinisoli]
MDGTPDQEALQEWMEERNFDRRDILKAVAVFTGSGWLFRNQFPTSNNTDSRLSEAEKSAATLADRLNVTDLRDPLMMSGLTPMVESTIETISEVLHDGTVTQGVWIAEKQRRVASVLSIIPGIDPPPTQSRPAKRLAHLEAVRAYYQSLNDVLQHVASTQRVLEMIEMPALYDGERPERALSSFVDIDAIETANEEAKSAGERTASKESIDTLLPEIEDVATQLGMQVRIQNQHSTAIQSYLDSANRFESGARQHEQRHLEQAESQFRAAKEALSDNILESNRAYSISTHGPTLHDYATHFTKRRQGLNRLIAACKSEIDSSTQNTRFNQGLSHLIDARGVVRQ